MKYETGVGWVAWGLRAVRTPFGQYFPTLAE